MAGGPGVEDAGVADDEAKAEVEDAGNEGDVEEAVVEDNGNHENEEVEEAVVEDDGNPEDDEAGNDAEGKVEVEEEEAEVEDDGNPEDDGIVEVCTSSCFLPLSLSPCPFSCPLPLALPVFPFSFAADLAGPSDAQSLPPPCRRRPAHMQWLGVAVGGKATNAATPRRRRA